jgi:hypothetical protein
MNRLLGNKRRASFDVNQRPSTFKVFYLGNVATSLTRGDGCADRPAKVLWDMHLKNQGRLGRKLRLTITNGGLQAESYSKTTSANDITLYCTNRIAYYLVATQLNPKMFIWVYRHVNIRSGLTTEVRLIIGLVLYYRLNFSCVVMHVYVPVKLLRSLLLIYCITIYRNPYVNMFAKNIVDK